MIHKSQLDRTSFIKIFFTEEYFCYGYIWLSCVHRYWFIWSDFCEIGINKKFYDHWYLFSQLFFTLNYNAIPAPYSTVIACKYSQVAFSGLYLVKISIGHRNYMYLIMYSEFSMMLIQHSVKFWLSVQHSGESSASWLVDIGK